MEENLSVYRTINILVRLSQVLKGILKLEKEWPGLLAIIYIMPGPLALMNLFYYMVPKLGP